MKSQIKQIVTVILSVFLLSCSADETNSETSGDPIVSIPKIPLASKIKYLALGDSYTIGQSVCETCRYPEQLNASLKAIYPETSFTLNIIAKTGWTTSNLISAVNEQNPQSNYDLVTLLIGVNNQYQGRDFSIYEKEFPELVTKAITLAKGDKKNVIVLSIPDYAYTPFGTMFGGTTKISNEISQYNTFAENYCKANGVLFISITDITQRGIQNPDLVAPDGLHPSKEAYTLFVDRILPKVKVVLQD
ncbi:SGNH/GDSL hydrolase family protein [Flavobacterium sp. ANB]|uniref:SGNH/GDSL hydrolase family protein n=1 Tax=unclassified Flavobacterium TaxID=196869 RepID=UPI0012B74512|nr:MULTISPECIES: SGNH/GDSL hydrolase family protein [unclassified Flavobacterium]MBF4515066.1 SGNH/GDSL hydrolase family protein [Flavobacterium sp. ANB]MTD69978.1 SGNH/GDSL hydrolase family protein [Flavobacterium sp. LC2016-13]